jgi:hypothetical protein
MKDNVLTMEMVQEMVDAMKPQKMVAMNPYVRLPAENEMTVAEEKEAGTLPGNIMLSKAVPLLTAYEFDQSVLDFPLRFDKIKVEIDQPTPIYFRSSYIWP